MLIKSQQILNFFRKLRQFVDLELNFTNLLEKTIST